VDDDPADVLRAARDVRAAVLARVPPADRGEPGHRIVAATHSGPIRAFATWAHGYDPGEPYNTEEVVVKVRGGGRTALVAYRNRVTEVNVPPPDEFPAWES
jgi:broad specificity phosphatase PhoE